MNTCSPFLGPQSNEEFPQLIDNYNIYPSSDNLFWIPITIYPKQLLKRTVKFNVSASRNQPQRHYKHYKYPLGRSPFHSNGDKSASTNYYFINLWISFTCFPSQKTSLLLEAPKIPLCTSKIYIFFIHFINILSKTRVTNYKKVQSDFLFSSSLSLKLNKEHYTLYFLVSLWYTNPNVMIAPFQGTDHNQKQNTPLKRVHQMMINYNYNNCLLYPPDSLIFVYFPVNFLLSLLINHPPSLSSFNTVQLLYFSTFRELSSRELHASLVILIHRLFRVFPWQIPRRSGR